MASDSAQTSVPIHGGGHRPLIALNAALIGVLAVVTLGPTAPGQARRGAPGEHSVISMKVQGSPSDHIVISDGLSQRISVVRWDPGRGQLAGVGVIDLRDETQNNVRGGGAR